MRDLTRFGGWLKVRWPWLYAHPYVLIGTLAFVVAVVTTEIMR